MAPSAALIIACAALAAVILQATITWTPATPSSSSASSKLAGWNMNAAAVAPNPSRLVLHEALADVPQGWASLGAAKSATPIHMRIALQSKDVSGLQKTLMDVSTPGSAKYGQHLNAAQVKSYMAPSSESVQAVTEWLASEGVSAQILAGHGDWLGFSTTASQAGRLFNASFSTYRHVSSGSEQVRTMAYSVPAHIQQHVELVHPMTTFAKPKTRHTKSVFNAPKSGPRRQSKRAVDRACSKQITPSCVQEVYGLPTEPATSSGNSITVTGYLGQFPQDADLKSFLKQFRTDMNASTQFTLQTTDDGSDPQNATEAGIEANLDIEYTVGIATGVPINFLSVGNDVDDGNLGGFLDTVNFISSEPAVSTVVTTSYDFDEKDLPLALANKLCNAYAALSAQGVSILFSSGDGGVAGTRSDNCTTFVPTFPSTCPYVTTVGATTGVPETAASLSAGGFSNYFGIPDYQARDVASYLTRLNGTNAGLFNASGRGYPDVAAYGQNVLIASGGTNEPVDGTSCATPIFASVVALLNDRLLTGGKPPLGFLNPWLYANASAALTDITQGSNPGCNTEGFPATAGWDPVTGLGSPNFEALLATFDLN